MITAEAPGRGAFRHRLRRLRALAAWPAGGTKPGFSYPPPSERQKTTIYLVDKPGAAQSTFAIGNPGPARSTPDYFALESMKELRGIAGSRPVTDEELATAKDSLVQRLPGMFGSVAGINRSLSTLWSLGLPDDYFQQYAKAVAAVTKDDVVRVARRYIRLDQLAIVIVGDRTAIEGPLKATGVGPIVLLDIEGNPVVGQ